MTKRLLMSALLVCGLMQAGAQTKTERWLDPQVTRVNTVQNHSSFFAFESQDLARQGDKGKSGRFLTLEGKWRFCFVTNHNEAPAGFFAPGYDDDALEILKAKKKGGYCVLQIDPSYEPEALERKQVFGITFEQGHNFVRIDDACLQNIVTQNKTLSPEDRDNLLISLIILKYTQSNSVCYVKDGQAIGIGAGQQSRIHCTRLAGDKADKWWLRQSPQVLSLPFRDDIKRPDRDNTIDVYTSDDYDDVLAEGVWQQFFTRKPEVFTREARKEWIAKNSGVAVGSDAFFPFGDNIERAHRSGVCAVAQPGGSIRDDNVIEVCNKYGMVMAFTGVRLFHH